MKEFDAAAKLVKDTARATCQEEKPMRRKPTLGELRLRRQKGRKKSSGKRISLSEAARSSSTVKRSSSSAMLEAVAVDERWRGGAMGELRMSPQAASWQGLLPFKRFKHHLQPRVTDLLVQAVAAQPTLSAVPPATVVVMDVDPCIEAPRPA